MGYVFIAPSYVFVLILVGRMCNKPSPSLSTLLLFFAMLLNSLDFKTGGSCTLTFERPQGWLRATWAGQINTHDAMSGALNYLSQAGPLHCLYLLNDNVSLRGPWFDSVEWLEQAWLPQARQLGLRYIAHVVQADTHSDILTLTRSNPVVSTIELQFFDDVATAEEWLRHCQLPRQSASSGPPLA